MAEIICSVYLRVIAPELRYVYNCSTTKDTSNKVGHLVLYQSSCMKAVKHYPDSDFMYNISNYYIIFWNQK